MQKEQSHVCTITEISTGFSVECPTCGTVGVVFDLKGDAEGVAARHEEIGGFEEKHG